MKYVYPISVVDNFLDNPNIIKEWGLTLDYQPHPEGVYPGKRTKNLREINDKFCWEFSQKILSLFYSSPPPQNYNLQLYFDITEKNKYEEGWIHRDPADISFILYLNQDTKINCGTTLYNLKSNHISFPDQTNYLKLKSQDFLNQSISEEGRKARKDYNSNFDKILDIPSIYNRLFIFPSTHPHSANKLDTGTEEDRYILVGYINQINTTQTPLHRIVSS